MYCHVDPYGNTIFNRTQMSAVLEELSAIQLELDGVALTTARALDVLIATYGNRPHRYLWFVGD